MAERLHNLKQTTNAFKLKGFVTGTKSKRFYRSGTSKNGGQWNSLEFGIRVNDGKVVYVVLNGYTRNEVFFYNRNAKVTKRVAWHERLNNQGDGFELIGVTLSVGKDENGGNINKVFTEYDAVEWLREHLSDDEQVDVLGTMEFSSFTNREGQTRRKIELAPNRIYYANEHIDFAANSFKETAEFENTIVFSSIDKETDENGKASGRYVLSGYSIGYNTIEPVSFIILEEDAAFANKIRKKMKPGYAIKMFGCIYIQHLVDTVVEEDDWGTTKQSPLKRVNAPTKREYVVYDVKGDTFDTETYSEKDVADAIRKIKAAKDAANNFGDKPNESVSNSNGWDDDDDDGEEAPWD